LSQLLKNLEKIYIYECVKTKVHGEYNKTWKLIDEQFINKQQDFNELDRNASGEIDYETIKLRTYKPMNIKKGYGISFKETTKPQYTVKSCPKIGNSVVYTCETYNGE